MTVETFGCPSCDVRLRRSPALAVGMQVRCPRCSHQFAVPPEEKIPEPPPPPAPPPVKEKASRSRVDDFELEDDYPSPGQPSRRERRDRYDDEDEDYPDRRSRQESLNPQTYVVDVGDWFSHAGRNWSDFLGPSILYHFLLGLIGLFLGFFLILLLIPLMIIPIIGPFLAGLLIGLVLLPLGVGWQIVALRILKGQDWEFGHFFSGFKYFPSLIGFGVLRGLISLALLMPIFLLTVVGGIRGSREAVLMILPIQFFVMAASIFLEIRLGLFAIFLIVDRRYGPIEAMAGSWRLTEGHFFGLLGILILLTLILMAGAVACLIGLLFVWPLAVLVITAGYLRAVGFDLDFERTSRRRRSSRRYDDEDDYDDRLRAGRRPRYEEDEEEIRRRAPRMDPERFRRPREDY